MTGNHTPRQTQNCISRSIHCLRGHFVRCRLCLCVYHAMALQRHDWRDWESATACQGPQTNRVHFYYIDRLTFDNRLHHPVAVLACCQSVEVLEHGTENYSFRWRRKGLTVLIFCRKLIHAREENSCLVNSCYWSLTFPSLSYMWLFTSRAGIGPNLNWLSNL